MSNSTIAEFKFVGLPVDRPGIAGLMQKLFDYQARVVDAQWAVAASDAALRRGPGPAVAMHPRLVIEFGKYRSAARSMMSALGKEEETLLQAHRGSIPRNISIPGSLGDITEHERVSTLALVETSDNLERVLADDCLPFFSSIGCRYVVPVTVNARLQQGYFSFAKIATMSNRYGIAEAEKRVSDRRVLAGAEMTGAMELLDFVDGLTRIFPIPFTFPLRRGWCSWHFYGDGFPQLFHIGFFRGFYQGFLTSINARAADWKQTAVKGLGQMHEPNIWRLLRHAIVGVNNLMCWANDHRTHADETGVVRLGRQLQVFAALKFLFADLLSIHHSPVPHSQATFAFGFLDKLANLKALILGASGNEESKIFRELASRDHGVFVSRLLKRELSATHPELSEAIVPLAEMVYENIYGHLIDELDPKDRSEKSALSRLRALRNLNHGSHLVGNGFEELYFIGKATVPPTLVALPFILALAMCSAPDEFIRYRAMIT